MNVDMSSFSIRNKYTKKTVYTSIIVNYKIESSFHIILTIQIKNYRLVVPGIKTIVI